MAVVPIVIRRGGKRIVVGQAFVDESGMVEGNIDADADPDFFKHISENGASFSVGPYVASTQSKE